jgi:multiple sugar transport system ATP-binding protein
MNFLSVRVSEENGALWAGNDGVRIKVPAEIAGRLRHHLGEEAALGIRPEDIHVATAADPPELGFDAVVEVVEKLGSETLLDVAVADEAMVASVEPSVRVAVHEKLRLAMNPARIHFFDNATEMAI